MPKPSTLQLNGNNQKPCLNKKISKAEWRRLQTLSMFETAARQEGFSVIAGIDEAGRGPLAGPVVAAACVFPEDVFLAGVNDSKQLTPKKRAELFDQIKSDSRIQYAVGVVSHQEIDNINIYQATIRAMLEAVSQLPCTPDFLLVDGLQLPHPSIATKKIVEGDCKSYSIAAASIIAKETRDQIMCELHEQWPQYGFHKHKGYGTKQHLDALSKYGPCPIHRFSFEPIKSIGGNNDSCLNEETRLLSS